MHSVMEAVVLPSLNVYLRQDAHSGGSSETLREQSETTGMPLNFYLYSTANVLYLTFYFM